MKRYDCLELGLEKENIWTFDGKGELLLTIMSSLAQEESRSISENVKWGHRKRFADGKVTVPFSHFLGYDRGSDGNLVINKDEDVIVKRIYRLFLAGMTPYAISQELTDDGIPTPMRKKVWSQVTIRSILKNEKYKGDALLQKNYTVDFLTKKQVPNRGEIPKYYVEGNHEAIITPEVFELVQQEFKRREQCKGRYSGVDIFSSKIHCAECGGFYGSKVWHSNDKYRRVVYQCNNKFKGEKCNTPTLDEKLIKELFVKAVNMFISDKDEIITNMELVQERLTDTKALENEKSELHEKITVLVEIIENGISENARTAQNQKEYQKRYDGLMQQYNDAKARYEKLEQQISDMLTRREIMEHIIKTLKKQNGAVTEFDETLWGSLLDYITVNSKDNIVFTFRGGAEITVS